MSGEGNTYRMPNSVWALSRVEVDDGHKDDGADKLLTTFTYGRRLPRPP